MDAVFDAVAPADIAVVRALLRGTFGKDTSGRCEEIARIVGLYAEASIERRRPGDRGIQRPDSSSRSPASSRNLRARRPRARAG